MRILFLTNNELSLSLFDWLRDEKHEIVLRFEDKVPSSLIDEFKPEWLISYSYRYIISKEILQLVDKRALNLHISLLPWNKGAQPNLWSFLENTPKGVTIHMIDEGLDTGDILIQKEIVFDEEKETLLSSYDKLNVEIQELFKAQWDEIKTRQIMPYAQCGSGSYHSIKAFERIKEILGNEEWQVTIPQLKSRYQQLLEKTG